MNNQVAIQPDSDAIKGKVSLATTTSTAANTIVAVSYPFAPSSHFEEQKIDRNKIESAIFSHIKALRALGKTEVDTREIARSLSIGEALVRASIQSLLAKGVKIK